MKNFRVTVLTGKSQVSQDGLTLVISMWRATPTPSLRSSAAATIAASPARRPTPCAPGTGPSDRMAFGCTADVRSRGTTPTTHEGTGRRRRISKVLGRCHGPRTDIAPTGSDCGQRAAAPGDSGRARIPGRLDDGQWITQGSEEGEDLWSKER